MKGLLKQMKRRRHACKGCLGTQQASAEIIEASTETRQRSNPGVAVVEMSPTPTALHLQR